MQVTDLYRFSPGSQFHSRVFCFRRSLGIAAKLAAVKL
jgi:hypothetical protein